MQSQNMALCADCQIGYHSPFERFERVATHPDGPMFLQRCLVCGALWQESIHDIRRGTSSDAAALGFVVKDSEHGV